MRTISSRQNPAVRAFRALADDADPTGARLLLDGVHLIRDAHDAGARFEIAAVSASKLARGSEEGDLAALLERQGIDVIAAPDDLFTAISPVRTPSGIAAIAVRKPASPHDICRHPGGFVLVAVEVQDPGNVGSLLRAAEAGGVTGALVCAGPAGASANPFSWKALRGSMGSVLRMPVAAGLDVDAALDGVRQAGGRLVAAVARGGVEPDAVCWSGHVALVLGGEGSGLSHEVVARCDERVTIPMADGVDSLNVAVAGGVLIYAARRQRV
jgi:TrmH family RNA methyltransferase